MAVLYVKDQNGKFVPIPALRGRKGDTPVRGVDYWTEEDVRQIQGYIDEEIADVSDEVERLNEEIVDQGKAAVKSVNGVKPDENGNVQVQGGGSEGVYELVEEIVLEEDVSSIFRDRTPAGETYNFKHLLLFCECPAVPGYTHSISVTYYVFLGATAKYENTIASSPSFFSSEYTTYASIRLDCNNGRVFGNSMVSANNRYNLSTLQGSMMQNGFKESDVIDGFCLWSYSGKFYAGLKIEIWGVRA